MSEQTQPSVGLLSFLESNPPPPNVVLWLMLVITLVGLGVKLAEFINAKISRRQDIEFKVDHDYWSRTVIYPFAIEPLFSFLVNSPANFFKKPGIADQEWKNESHKFGRKKSEVLARIEMLRTFDEQAYARLERCLQTLQDEVTTYCAAKGGFVDPASKLLSHSHLTGYFSTALTEATNAIKEFRLNRAD